MQQKVNNSPVWTGADFTVEAPQTVYINTSALDSSIFSTSSSLSAVLDKGLPEFEVIDRTIYNSITSFNSGLSSIFRESIKKNISLQMIEP